MPVSLMEAVDLSCRRVNHAGVTELLGNVPKIAKSALRLKARLRQKERRRLRGRLDPRRPQIFFRENCIESGEVLRDVRANVAEESVLQPPKAEVWLDARSDALSFVAVLM